MRAARWHGTRDVRVEEVDLRLPLDAGMVEVEVAFCGICGSDIAEFAQGPFAIRTAPHVLSGQEPPLTLGHELSGRITAVGDGVRHLEPGARVAVDACWRCEVCPACRAGRYNHCASGGSIGLCSDGGFAARVRFPAYAAVPLPEAVSDRAGALLEPLAVGLHAIDRGRGRAADRLIVLGYGPIGAATAFVGRALGLDVIVSEPHPGRRARAVEHGMEVFAPSDDARSDARRLRDLTGGGADMVVDATGVAAALRSALDMTRRGASIVLVGLPKTELTLDAAKLVLFERALSGSLGYAHDLPRVAALIAGGALDPAPLITRTVALDDVPSELARLADDPGDDVKVLVDVRGPM